MTEQQTLDNINETLDRMEARMDEMNRMLSEIIAEIEKHQQPKVFETDGEVMFRNKRWSELNQPGRWASTNQSPVK